MLQVLIFLSLIFLSSIFLTGLVRRYVLSKNIVDLPNNRSSHHIPTPRGGGIGIVLLCNLCFAGLAFEHTISFSLWYALTGGLLVAGIGWLDDVRSIRAVWRAGIHLVAALWAIYWLNRLSHFSAASYLFAVISVVWGINLYNFMDGIDGLAAGEGVFISLAAGIVLAWMGVFSLALLCGVVAAAIAGFLVWNWPPAKIFMGDVGSGYLGFVFAVVAMAVIKMNLLSFSFWIIISAVFLCDATFTVLYRLLSGKRWYEAHKEHVYQRFIQRGVPHKIVTVGILLINGFILFPAACVVWVYPVLSGEVVTVVLVIFFGVWSYIQFLLPQD